MVLKIKFLEEYKNKKFINQIYLYSKIFGLLNYDNNEITICNYHNSYVEELIRLGYGTEEIFSHEYPDVFNEYFVIQGRFLDKFINHPYSFIRQHIVSLGYRLDKFIGDESIFVREEVIRQNYGLDKFIDDKSIMIRVAVAKQGYDLENLKNDTNKLVRIIATEKLNGRRGVT